MIVSESPGLREPQTEANPMGEDSAQKPSSGLEQNWSLP